MEDNRLKHRLIGATALVALGVVFIPMIVELEPPPGTQLNGVQLPPPPKFNLFPSENEEKQSLAANLIDTPKPPPTPPTPAPDSQTPDPAVPEPLPPPQISESTPSPPPPIPPPATIPKANVYQTEIRDGASLSGQFAKAGLKSDQVAAVLKLGPAVKDLANIQSGQRLWIKPGPQKDIQELIYYGPGNKIYAHIVRRNGKLQLASNDSALQILTNQKSNKKEEKKDERIAKAEIPKEKKVSPPQEINPAKIATPAKTPRPIETKTPRPTEQANNNHSGAWVVQIASLNREEVARALIGNLRNKGFPAFLESISDGNKKLWRVRIGPSTDREEVNNLRSRLEKDARLTGNVLPYP